MYQQGPSNIPPYGRYSKIPLQGPPPLEQAIKQLLKQYFRVFTSPGRATFTQELPKAAWNIVWVQLISYAIFLMLPIALLDIVIATAPTLLAIFHGSKTWAFIEGFFLLFAIASLLSPLLLIPLFFFTRLIIQYLAAKMLGGSGKLVEHGYAFALIDIPIPFLTIVSNLVPVLGPLALAVYEIILHILMVMAVHRIGGVKAAIVVFSPFIVAVMFAIVVALYGILFGLYG